MNRALIAYIFGFIAYLFLQVIVLRNIIVFDTAFCFAYIVFLLMLPVETATINLLFIAMLMGISVDTFYDSLGVHAASSVFIMFIRNGWLKLLTPQGGYDPGVRPVISLNGFSWFIVYSVPLIFIHHTLIFYIEAGGFHLFGYTLLKVVFSTLLTALVIVLLQYIFPVKGRL
ncbi:MAG TPA: Rod shape-determining protein MreD [Cyclobacteriaceae bacterium]|nr:Rod shape-determining protein MreD [Cyclobacteriaceae bacterium]